MPLFLDSLDHKNTKTREEVIATPPFTHPKSLQQSPKTHHFLTYPKAQTQEETWNSHTQNTRFVWMIVMIVIYLPNLGSLVGVNLGTPTLH